MKGTCIDGHVKGQMPESDDGERTKCAFFVILVGKNPQTDETINDPGCSVAFMPVIALEGNGHLRHVVASVDKTATEVRSQHMTFLELAKQKRLTDADPTLPKLVGGKQT